jgi:hypothetical protein
VSGIDYKITYLSRGPPICDVIGRTEELQICEIYTIRGALKPPPDWIPLRVGGAGDIDILDLYRRWKLNLPPISITNHIIKISR